jgi:hypothetical protein
MTRISITITSNEIDLGILTQGIDDRASALAATIAEPLFQWYANRLFSLFPRSIALRLCLAYHIAESSALITQLEREGVEL